MADVFWRRLTGRDSHTQRMKALLRIERCRRDLGSILSKSIIDESFSTDREQLRAMVDEVCGRLVGAFLTRPIEGDWPYV